MGTLFPHRYFTAYGNFNDLVRSASAIRGQSLVIWDFEWVFLLSDRQTDLYTAVVPVTLSVPPSLKAKAATRPLSVNTRPRSYR